MKSDLRNTFFTHLNNDEKSFSSVYHHYFDLQHYF